jgi:hypothetical protein
MEEELGGSVLENNIMGEKPYLRLYNIHKG